VKNELERLGHKVVVPRNIDKYASGELSLEQKWESSQHKIEHDLIRGYYQIIADSDVLLVINQDKQSQKNYIGGNTFLEIGFAHVLRKPIYLYNEIPDMSYTSEVIAMSPTVIDGDLSKIN
jgi:nucleoside 2-deoxyribosyltransferase